MWSITVALRIVVDYFMRTCAGVPVLRPWSSYTLLTQLMNHILCSMIPSSMIPRVNRKVCIQDALDKLVGKYIPGPSKYLQNGDKVEHYVYV